MKRFKNILCSLGCGLMIGSVITPIFNSLSSKSKNDTNDYAHVLAKKNGYVRKESKYYHFSNKYDNEGQSKNITQEQLDDRISAISDKLQAQLIAAGETQENIDKIVGTFLANAYSFNPQDNSSTPLSEDEIISQKYQYIDDEASKLGVDVIDFHTLNDQVTFSSIDLLQGILKDVGTPKYGEYGYDAICSNYLSILQNNLFERATKNLWSNLDLSLALNDFNKEFLNFDPITSRKLSDSELDKNYRETNLRSILTYSINQVTYSFLNSSIDNSNFLLNIFNYSNKHDHSEKGIMYKNKVIPFSYYKDFLNYRYPTVYGSDFGKYSLKSIAPSTPGEYDQNIINSECVSLPFGGYSGDHATYREGEIYPGYQLYMYIEDMDVSTNSNKCDLDLIFGISETKKDVDFSKLNSSNDILWNTTDGKIPLRDGSNLYNEDDEQDKSKIENSTTKISLNVSDKTALVNIANNEYYPEKEWVFTQSSLKDSVNTPLYPESADLRSYLDDILRNEYVAPEGSTSDKYVIDDKHPLILSNPDDFEGIPLPEKVGDPLHTNQKFVFKATGINTNNNSLFGGFEKVNYAKDENGTDVITDLLNVPFKSGNDESKAVWIQYDISPEIKTNIQNAISNFNAANDAIESLEGLSDLFGKDSGIASSSVSLASVLPKKYCSTA